MILWVLAGFLLLDLTLVGLLFVPAIQTFAVNKVTQALSEKWGTEISMKDIRITPTLKLVAHDFRIRDHHNNDMIYVGTVKGRLLSFRLKPTKLKFGHIDLDHANVVIRKYKGENVVNISKWAKVFHKENRTPKSFLLTATKLKLANSRVAIVMDDKRQVFDTKDHPDIDYAFLELKDINWESKDFKVYSNKVTTIATKFKHLALNQYGGFSLTDGQADFYICDTAMVFDKMNFITPDSRLNMDLAFHYDSWGQLGDFVDSVNIVADIRPTDLCMQDVAAFAPALRQMKETFHLKSGRFEGPVSDFKLIGLQAGWGHDTHINGDFAFQDITHFQKAHITANIDSSYINVPELAAFTLPNGKTIPVNKTLAQLGGTSLKCVFSGTLSEFDATLKANTALGAVAADLGTFTEEGKLQFQGTLASPNLNLARLTRQGKLLGTTDAQLAFDGKLGSTTLDKKSFQGLQAHLTGDVKHIDLYGYRLRNTQIKGDYQNQLYNCTLTGHDPNFKSEIIAQLDLSEETPALQSSISLPHFDAGAIASRMPRLDSATAKGFDKIICALQKNPDLRFGFDNFTVALRGTNLDNVNGYAGCDNIRIYNGTDSIINDRLRLTAINNERAHKYILASGIVSATLETSYPVASIKDSLQNIAHAYFPTLVAAAKTTPQVPDEIADNGYIRFRMDTYRTWHLTRLLMPNLFIAPNSTVDIDLTALHDHDKIEADIPFLGLRNKFAAYSLHLNGHSTGSGKLDLTLNSDSTVAIVGTQRLPFRDINLDASSTGDSIGYDLRWFNDFNNDRSHHSKLAGRVDVSNTDDIRLNLRNSKFYLNDLAWFFNNQNEIHFQKSGIEVNDLRIQNKESKIMLNGKYAKGTRERLRAQIENVDLSTFNTMLGNMDLGGRLSADASLINPNNRVLVFGKALAEDFAFNQETLGNVFLFAGLDTVGDIRFSGGIFKDDTTTTIKIEDYTFRDFQQEPNTIARLNGQFLTDKKDFSAHATFDTLQAGFIAPFLSGFSHLFSGTASGNLSFYANPKATYFDGLVKAIDVQMGIAPLGTTYHIKNQDIRFNREGIFFDNMLIQDKSGNEALMNGRIKHNFFKDMDIDLRIHTDRIMVLHTPKDATSVFYGDGIVSGDVSIKGNGNHIRFFGSNLKTLDGSRVVLQVTSANSASQSSAIHFTPKNSSTTTVIPESQVLNNDKTALDFDFTFDITNDADIVLYLESIGGTMNARADGPFQLTYNDNDGLNLYGNLALHSGDFKISLFNVVNSRFTLVPGGNILFDGPLEDMVVNVSAYKGSKTSLSDIVPAEYLNSGSTNVNAYLHLNGPIMQRIEPTFSFELPNSSEEVNNIFFSSIDTTNKENLTRQFAYFMVTNNFMPAQMFSNSDRNNVPGLNMFSNIVNNMLGDLFATRNGSFGITYNQATETSSAEYGVTGSANLLKDRITVETSIGYYDDRNTDALYNMYGDFTVGYNINKSGTWKVKAYTYIGERDENNYYMNDQINYTAGVALAYKQDFNSVRRRGKTPKPKKKKKELE